MLKRYVDLLYFCHNFVARNVTLGEVDSFYTTLLSICCDTGVPNFAEISRQFFKVTANTAYFSGHDV